MLIHLINMLRHRRVEWAAMEFLLLSQRKHRTWIILKQLLLLAAADGGRGRRGAHGRPAAVAQPVGQPAGQRADAPHRAAGRQLLHVGPLGRHQRLRPGQGGGRARSAARPPGRRSRRPLRSCGFPGPLGRARAQPDLIRKRVDAEFASTLAEKLKSIDVSQTAAEPAPALEALDQLLGDADGERRIVYLISDFRAAAVGRADRLEATACAAAATADAEMRLIDCVNAARPNLAIVSLEPAEGIRAAGVPWFMEVAVRNFGATPAKDVPVLLVRGRPRPARR